MKCLEDANRVDDLMEKRRRSLCKAKDCNVSQKRKDASGCLRFVFNASLRGQRRGGRRDRGRRDADRKEFDLHLTGKQFDEPLHDTCFDHLIFDEIALQKEVIETSCRQELELGRGRSFEQIQQRDNRKWMAQSGPRSRS